MSARLLAIAFIVAVLLPGAVISAQPSGGGAGASAGANAGSRGAATTGSQARSNAKNHPNNKPCNGNANNCHNRYPNNRYPWWANSVYVNGGSVDNYLATQPPHTPPPNHVNTGGETFKSIGN